MARVCVALAGLALLASSCADSGVDEGRPSSAAERASDVLEDGVITFSEYEHEVFRFVDCIDSAEYEVVGLELRDVAQVYQYQVPAAAVDDGTFDACYEPHLATVDELWQTRFSPGVDVAPAQQLVDLRVCLAEIGYSAPEELDDIGEILDAASADGFDVFGCL